jgi:hypothetical protein
MWFKESDTFISGILKIEALFLLAMGVVVCFHNLEAGISMIVVSALLVGISKL